MRIVPGTMTVLNGFENANDTARFCSSPIKPYSSETVSMTVSYLLTIILQQLQRTHFNKTAKIAKQINDLAKIHNVEYATLLCKEKIY